MHAHYHRSITQQALPETFSQAALQTILKANVRQDRLARQIGRPEYHFDNAALAQGQAYVDQQHRETGRCLADGQARPAWKAFGRLVHAAQDFYAHTNYAELWVRRHGMGSEPFPGAPAIDPSAIDPLDPEVLAHAGLVSGHNYLALEIGAYLVPRLRGLIERLSPGDSHLRHNLDGPERGSLFPYALAAAIKRTRWEYDRLLAGLTAPQAHLFHQGE